MKNNFYLKDLHWKFLIDTLIIPFFKICNKNYPQNLNSNLLNSFNIQMNPGNIYNYNSSNLNQIGFTLDMKKIYMEDEEYKNLNLFEIFKTVKYIKK